MAECLKICVLQLNYWFLGIGMVVIVVSVRPIDVVGVLIICSKRSRTPEAAQLCFVTVPRGIANYVRILRELFGETKREHDIFHRWVPKSKKLVFVIVQILH